MSDSTVADLALWSAQGFLALFFLAAGAPKISGRGIERWTGFSELPRPLVILIGVAEELGAVGLVLPMAAGVLPWLTPLAGIGLALIVLIAAGFHLRADERLQAVETGLWAALAAVVAIGRWDLLSRFHVPSWTLIGAVVVLVPAVILNIVILLRRPVPATRLEGEA